MSLSFKTNLLQRLLSYLTPVLIFSNRRNDEELLEIFLYKNRWQLATETALYSDGKAYAPFKIAFKNLESQQLSAFKSCLVLGAGLGSVPQILHQHKIAPSFSLVDINPQILKWVAELLPHYKIENFKTINADAVQFVKEDKSTYDLICVDVFDSRLVPSAIITSSFFSNCKNLMHDKSILIMNYIFHDAYQWNQLQYIISEQFSQCQILERDTNKIIICKF